MSEFIGARNPLLGPAVQPQPQQAAGPDMTNLLAATRDISMTPQEQFLYRTHLDNLYGPGKVVHPDGAVSTLYQMSFDRDGRTYNIPTVWGGAILPPPEAIKRAETLGLDRFPSYGSGDEAERRYQAMHGYMDRDTATWRGRGVR